MAEFTVTVKGSTLATVKALPGRARITLGANTNGRFSEIVTADEARALWRALGNYLAWEDNAGVKQP